MTFLTTQQYENYSYRFFIEDNGTYVVKIFLEDSYKTTRYYRSKQEVIEKYIKHFPDIGKYLKSV